MRVQQQDVMHYQKDQSRQPQQLPSDPSQESHPKPQQSPSDPNQESDPKPQQSPSDPSQESDPKPQQSPGGSAIASSSPGTKSSKSQRSVKFDMSPSGSSFFTQSALNYLKCWRNRPFRCPLYTMATAIPAKSHVAKRNDSTSTTRSPRKSTTASPARSLSLRKTSTAGKRPEEPRVLFTCVSCSLDRHGFPTLHSWRAFR